MKIKSDILLIFVIFFNSILISDSKNLTKTFFVINGGKKVSHSKFTDNAEYYSTLREGETLAYWKDKMFGYDYGPSFSNKARVKISNELITEVTFQKAGVSDNQNQLETNIAISKANTKIKKFFISSSISNQELLKRLEETDASFQISFSKLTNAFSQIEKLSGYSINEYLNFLISESLLNPAEYEKLKSFLKENNIDLNISLMDMISTLKDKGFDIKISGSKFFRIIKKYNLTYNMDTHELNQILDSANIEIEASLNLIKTVLNEFGIVYQFDSDQQLTRIDSGKPEIILKKYVKKEVASYNSIIEYKIFFKNIGNLSARDIVIIDSLPKDLRLKKEKVEGFKYRKYIEYKGSNQIVVWKIKEDLKSGEEGIINFSCRIVSQ